MIKRFLFFYLLCFLAFNSYSNLEDRDLYINFNHYENFVGTYLVKEIHEARGQIVTSTKDGFYTKFLKRNCHQLFYYRYDKNEHYRSYTLKNNLNLKVERDRTVNIGPVLLALQSHKNILKPLVHSKCGLDSYITVLLKGTLRNGHEFRSDFTISLKNLKKKKPRLILKIKDKRQKLSISDLNQAVLGPTLLLKEEQWNGVWEELDPLAPALQINTPLQLK